VSDQGPGATPDLVLCPGGPVLLRGSHVVQDEDGVLHTTTRPVSAVCRCGHSASAPWCDGTHKVVRHDSRTREGTR
jgi:CDGSH-type Zn-finger protein